MMRKRRLYVSHGLELAIISLALFADTFLNDAREIREDEAQVPTKSWVFYCARLILKCQFIITKSQIYTAILKKSCFISPGNTLHNFQNND